MIYYRMSSVLSANAPPRFAVHKLKVAKCSLESFVEAFKDVKPSMYFMFDNAGGDYLEMVQKVCPFPFTYDFTQYGNYNSCLKQYQLAEKSQDEVLLFLEDDYIWKRGVGKYFMAAIKELGICTPYDNPDFYAEEPYKSHKEIIRLVNNWHWRTTISTTMTFGITKEKFDYNRKTFDYHGPNDSALWHEIPDRVWCPIPSFATHYVQGKLAPGIDWEELIS